MKKLNSFYKKIILKIVLRKKYLILTRIYEVKRYLKKSARKNVANNSGLLNLKNLL